MAKTKILIEFTANPILGNAFSYNISISGSPFLYSNGLNTLNLDYVSGSNVGLTSIGLKSTLSETIDATVNFLVQNYYSTFITYQRVDNSIEVILNFEDATVTYPESANANIIISDDPYIPNLNYKLKYITDWADTENVPYSVRIYQRGYTGGSTEVSGYAVLEYGSVQNNLEPIRGNGLNLNLNASLDLTLEDLYTEEENSFSVKMYRNNNLLFDGYLKPDGVYQSFVQDQWIISLSCVDGLGLLKDLAFVKSNGEHWTENQRAIDIVYNCLKRTGLSMNINTSVNIYYQGLTASDTLDPLHEVYVSVDRFVKDDNDTIMDCNEVLTSILNLFNAVICQVDAEWYIFRPNEIFENNIVKFRQYSQSDNSYIRVNTKNLGFNLGSQIDNYYPHHAGGNQQIEIKGSVSAARINYKYGFITGIAENKNLTHDGYDYPGWTVIDEELIILDPLKSQGLITQANFYFTNPIIQTNGVSLNTGDLVSVRFVANILDSYSTFFVDNVYKIEIGDYYYNYSFDTNTYQWSNTAPTSEFQDKIFFIYTASLDQTLDLLPLPTTGLLKITIYQSNPGATGSAVVEHTLVDIINKSEVAANTGAVGEFHTVQRQNRPSSISKDTYEIYNGDSPNVLYEGAIFKNDNTSSTSFWYRKNKTESKPILQIAVEDILRLQQKPQKIFTGDIYGYMPYLSIISINNLDGKFMPIEWNFDGLRNITSVKLLQIFGDELNDIDYKFTLDYGKTTKVTITS